MSVVLNLTLHKKAFDVMVTGEKKDEYRDIKPYWIKRLFNDDGMPKFFQLVRFTNGYGDKRPFFIADFVETKWIEQPIKETYSNGLIVDYPNGAFVISLGDVLKIGNLKWT